METNQASPCRAGERVTQETCGISDDEILAIEGVAHSLSIGPSVNINVL